MSDGQKDSPNMPRAGGIRLASNVRVQGIRPELLVGLMIVSDLCWAYGIAAVVTSIVDGLHMRNSLHYSGAGVDFEIGDAPNRSVFASELRGRLGRDYDVVDEGDHIHVEYQPHERAGN